MLRDEGEGASVTYRKTNLYEKGKTCRWKRELKGGVERQECKSLGMRVREPVFSIGIETNIYMRKAKHRGIKEN